MLTESLVIACAGGAAGVVLAAWSLSALRALLPAQFAGLPGIEHLGIDVRVLAAAVMVSLRHRADLRRAAGGCGVRSAPRHLAERGIARRHRQRQVAAAALGACRRRARALADPARRRLAARRQLQQPDQRLAGLPAGAARDRAGHAAGRALRRARARRAVSSTRSSERLPPRQGCSASARRPRCRSTAPTRD